MSLSNKLEQIAAASAKQIPASALTVMKSSTETVSSSLTGRNIPAEGDPLPTFELNDSQDKTHRSSDLVAGGPLVLSFFRGTW